MLKLNIQLFAEGELNFHAYSGSKLSYSATSEGEYTEIKGITEAPDIGSSPEEIESTTFNNKKYKTSIQGLMDAPTFEFQFNMEDPDADSNIKLASDLEVAGEPVYWKYELSNGITVTFRSKVSTMIRGGGYGDIIGFNMTLSPIEEPEVDLGL